MATSTLLAMFKHYSETVVIATTNDTITFRETTAGANLTAVLTAGTYYWAALSWEIKRALEAAGASTYTVSYSHATRKYTILSDGVGGGNDFELDVGVTADDVLPTLGFTVDATGALTYTSDTAVPSQSTMTCTMRIRRPQQESESFREDTVFETGRRQSTYHGQVERYRFLLEFESIATAQSLKDLWDQCAQFGNSFDFYPDSTDGSTYVSVFWDSTTFRPIEMTDRNLYNKYETEIPLAFKVPAGGTVTLRGLLDRSPA